MQVLLNLSLFFRFVLYFCNLDVQIFNYALTWYESCLVWEPTGILRWLRWKGCTFAINYIHAEDEQTNYVDIGPVNKVKSKTASKKIPLEGEANFFLACMQVLNMASVWFEGKQKVVDGVSEVAGLLSRSFLSVVMFAPT